jgi:hypothetical protein
MGPRPRSTRGDAPAGFAWPDHGPPKDLHVPPPADTPAAQFDLLRRAPHQQTLQYAMALTCGTGDAGRRLGSDQTKPATSLLPLRACERVFSVIARSQRADWRIEANVTGRAKQFFSAGQIAITEPAAARISSPHLSARTPISILFLRNLDHLWFDLSLRK